MAGNKIEIYALLDPICQPEVRASNGRKNAKAIHSDPGRKRVWMLKKIMGSLIGCGHVTETVKAKLRFAANKSPDLFGCWANI